VIAGSQVLAEIWWSTCGLVPKNRKFVNKNNEPARTGKSGRVALIGAGDRGGVSADRGCNSGLNWPVRLLVSASREKVQADFCAFGGNFTAGFCGLMAP